MKKRIFPMVALFGLLAGAIVLGLGCGAIFYQKYGDIVVTWHTETNPPAWEDVQ